jgi:hypothetical protein
MFSESDLCYNIQNEGYLADGEYFLCDSGYTCSRFTVNIVLGQRLTYAQKKYNKAHKSARSCIERAFGQLKGRWRRLTAMDFNISNGDAVLAIIVACILHNFCLSLGEESVDPYQLDDAEQGVGDELADPDPAYQRDVSIRDKLISKFEL